MIKESIKSPFLRLIMFHETVIGEEKRGLTKAAFLFLIIRENAQESNKLGILEFVLCHCPDALDIIKDEEMFSAFEDFCNEAIQDGMIVSLEEMPWIEKYVRNSDTRLRMRLMICSMIGELVRYNQNIAQIRACSDLNLIAQEEDEFVRLAGINFILGRTKGPEFSNMEHKKKILYELLWIREYNMAAKLGIDDPEIIMDVIAQNVNSGFFHDALCVAERFLPNGLDIIEELRQIASASRVST